MTISPSRLAPSLLAISLFALAAAFPAFGSPPPDSTLFTTYSMDAASTNITWMVCGSTVGTEGCYASGSLGPFGKVGAMLEGNPAVNLMTSTVTRAIYVLDIAAGTASNEVKLYVYKKTDSVSATFDTVTVSLVKTILLPLTGGTSVHPTMAANAKFVYAGTAESSVAVRVQKNNFNISQIGGTNITAITADKYGYVTVTLGNFGGFPTAFEVFDPNGNGLESGGGAWIMPNTVKAFLPSSMP